MNSLRKNNTFDLAELPKGRKTLKYKWVFMLKQGDGKLVKHKVRLVVKCFSQKKLIDFDDIFLPVMKMSSTLMVPGW